MEAPTFANPHLHSLLCIFNVFVDDIVVTKSGDVKVNTMKAYLGKSMKLIEANDFELLTAFVFVVHFIPLDCMTNNIQ